MNISPHYLAFSENSFTWRIIFILVPGQSHTVLFCLYWIKNKLYLSKLNLWWLIKLFFSKKGKWICFLEFQVKFQLSRLTISSILPLVGSPNDFGLPTAGYALNTPSLGRVECSLPSLSLSLSPYSKKGIWVHCDWIGEL